jgi:glutaredoxin 3
VSNVVVFGTTNCLWCRQATKYFGENRVPFQEVGVERDPAAARDLLWRKTGPTVVPVIQIGASPTSASTSPPSGTSWRARAYEPRGTWLGAKDEARRWPRTPLWSGCPVPGAPSTPGLWFLLGPSPPANGVKNLLRRKHDEDQHGGSEDYVG